MSVNPSNAQSPDTPDALLPADGRARWLTVAQITGLVLLFTVTRLASIPAGLHENDEAVFAACGVRCHQTGELPYVGAFDNKGPLLYWCYQGLFALFGDYNMTAVHAAAQVGVAVNVLLIWRIAVLCFGRRRSPGASACLLYLIAMSDQANYMAFAAETPSSLLILLSTWLVLRSRGPLSARSCLVVGALLMLAGLSRQNAAVTWPIMGFGVTLVSWSYNRRLLVALGRGLLVLVGGLIPLGVVVILYAGGGHLSELYFGLVGYNTQYYVAAMEKHPLQLLAALAGLARLLDELAVITLLALLGIAATAGRSALAPESTEGTSETWLQLSRRRLVLAITVGIWLAMSMGWRFYDHYRILDLPLTCVLAHGGYVYLLDHVPTRGARRLLTAGLAVLLAAICITGEHAPFLFVRGWNRFYPSQCKAAGERLRLLTTPTESIFVWGKEQTIYYFARRRMATRFCKMTYQVGLIEGATKMPPARDTSEWAWPESWDLMFEDLAADPPAFVVDASAMDAFAWGRYPVSKYPRLAEWLAANYERFDEQGELVIYRQRIAGATQPTETQPATEGT